MSNFRTIDRQTGFLLPPSVDEWLLEKHLARFVVEVIEGLDLRAMSGSYRGSGSASYHPRMLLGILVYGYATGVFSSRKLERASYNSVAFLSTPEQKCVGWPEQKYIGDAGRKAPNWGPFLRASGLGRIIHRGVSTGAA